MNRSISNLKNSGSNYEKLDELNKRVNEAIRNSRRAIS